MTNYTVTAPEQKHWNESKHEWEYEVPYDTSDTSRTPNGNVAGVEIKKGVGHTNDPLVAVIFFDMGYKVEPDPHEEALRVSLTNTTAAEMEEIKRQVQHDMLVEQERRRQLGLPTNPDSKLAEEIINNTELPDAPRPPKRPYKRRVIKPTEVAQ